MDRFKDFNSTGVAPDGKLFAGDLVLFQDLVAALSDFTQVIDTGSLRIGDTGITLSKFGTAEAQFNSMLRVAGNVKALGGILPGSFTTTTRNAIPAGQRPTYLIVRNTTTGQYEYNNGSDTTPDWQPLVPVELVTNAITQAMLQDSVVGQAELAASAVIASKVDGSLKPSVSAAAGTEALRALGTTASTATAGNDARLSDTRTPTDGTVTNAKVASGAAIAYSKLSLTAAIQQADLDAALTAVIAGKLPLVGGTITGTVTWTGGGSSQNVVVSEGSISYSHFTGIIGGIFLNTRLATTGLNRVRLFNADPESTAVAAGILTIANYNQDQATIGGTDGGGTDTVLKIRTVTGGLQRVSLGPANSGGAGFRQLLVAN